MRVTYPYIVFSGLVALQLAKTKIKTTTIKQKIVVEQKFKIVIFERLKFLRLCVRSSSRTVTA